MNESLSAIALQLRSAIDHDELRIKIRAATTRRITKNEQLEKAFASPSSPELDVKLSSWVKENCYELPFGLGFGVERAEAVRRPRFLESAMEGVAYLLPKTLDGEILVGICLRAEDLMALRHDEEFHKYASYIG